MRKKFLIFISIMFFIITLNFFGKLNNVYANESQIIEDGIYEIETCLDSEKVIDVYGSGLASGTNVQIYTRNNSNCQRVNIKYQGNGYYTLSFVHSNKMLDLYAGLTNDHTNVWQYEKNNSEAQEWIIKDAGDGYYNIISRINKNAYLTVKDGNNENFTNVEIHSGNGSDLSQKFKLNKIENIVGKKVIEDGIYEIETKVDTNKVIDVYASSKESGANVQIYTRNNTNCQRVNVKYQGDGSYTLSFVHSNKMLDLYAGLTYNHTNIWQYDSNGSDAQKWIIKDVGNGYYNIISKKSANSNIINKYLTVKNGNKENFTNIEINSGNGTSSSQKFKFNKIEKLVGKKVIEDGLYEIETGLDSSKTLDVNGASTGNGANVQIYSKNFTNCQKVNIKYNSDGYYTLSFLHSNKVLDVSGGVTADHTNVWQYTSNESDAQKWLIKDAGNGYYNIMPKSSIDNMTNKYLTVQNGKNENGANIEINSGNGTSSSQKFKFIKTLKKEIEDGVYEVETSLDSNKVLDVSGASTDNGANVQIYSKNNSNCQKLEIKYEEDGYCTLKFAHSNKVLDVYGGQVADHTNVWQYTSNGSNAQKWYIKSLEDGYYNIISKSSNTYLTVANGKNNDGANIEICSGNGTNSSQKFKFNVTKVNIGINIDTSKYPGYKEKIDELKKNHPTWNFELLYTGLTFGEAVNGEYSKHSANLVPTSSGTEWICPECGTKLYDTGWYGASDKAIAYYMDTRNWLNENGIFQFLNVNLYSSSSVSTSGIQSIVKSTFLENYVDDINTACKNKNVNPYFIISRLIQENGKSGSYTSKGMDGGDGKTYFNPFNLGASGNSRDEVQANALSRAKNEGWDSMEKALEGGISILKTRWLDNYQNTLYLNKFNVDVRKGQQYLYIHQYMQNLIAPYSEGNLLKSYYKQAGKTETELTFIIPVYEGMSSTLSERPSDEKKIEEYPINFVVNTDVLNFRSSASTSGDKIGTLTNGTVILSIQRGINSNWHHIVTKDGKCGYASGNYLKQINDEVICNYSAYIKTHSSGGTNVRTGPSTTEGFSKVAYLADYTQVTVIDDSTYKGYEGSDWVQWSRIILSDGRQAFVPSEYVHKN